MTTKKRRPNPLSLYDYRQIHGVADLAEACDVSEGYLKLISLGHMDAAFPLAVHLVLNAVEPLDFFSCIAATDERVALYQKLKKVL